MEEPPVKIAPSLLNSDFALLADTAKKISEAVKRIARGSDEKIEVGDASVVKEWTFAGDVVSGVWMLVNQDKIMEANIGSGIGYSIEDWINTCFSIIGKDKNRYILKKNDFVPDYKQLVSDSSLIRSVGWKPQISFEQLAQMMLTQ